ncbi:Uncharacterised protein family UPF0311 [Rhabdaerophilaceae bacterium]
MKGIRETTSQTVNRRQILAGATTLAAGAGTTSVLAQATGGPLSPTIPIVLPKTEFVYEAIFDLEPTLELGQGPLGQRRIVPITGGIFQGPRIKGTVLPHGGADRQLIRKDGARLLDALYELKADDGAIITVNNRVTIVPRPDGSSYAFSKIDVTAPEGPHDWLNRLVFVGTLHSLRPEPKVLIRVYSLA